MGAPACVGLRAMRICLTSGRAFRFGMLRNSGPLYSSLRRLSRALASSRARATTRRNARIRTIAERDATIAKLTSDREKLETYTKKTLGNVQEKYSVLVQTYKNQIRDKQERISRLEGELERHRRELASSREFSAVTPNGGGEACV